ncbi:MAG: hypothetical protein JKY43_03525 [Phycisphaerales bacterium]|nr:hypothetical protein [Phycisphaerales bacterium]
MKHPQILILLSALIFALLLTGCSIKPTYTVRVLNDSTTNLNARIEHRPKFADAIILESITVKAGQEQTLGPVESPPMERVVLLIGAAGSSINDPEQFVIKRGSYTARISTGTSTSWTPYNISVLKD